MSDEKSEAGRQADGDEKGVEQSPKPVGFWSPKLKHVRQESFRKWLLTTVVLMVFILAVLSICELSDLIQRQSV